MNTEIQLKISPQHLKKPSLKLNYNEATGFKDVPSFDFCGKTYAIYDQYCKNADCACTEATIDFVEVENNKIKDTSLLVHYDYEKKKILSTESVLPQHFESELVADEGFNNLLNYRHWRAKLAFTQYALKMSKERMHNLITSKKLLGRNDPCVCGSGRKYKNCCGK
jgi:SEC-C motif